MAILTAHQDIHLGTTLKIAVGKEKSSSWAKWFSNES